MRIVLVIGIFLVSHSVFGQLLEIVSPEFGKCQQPQVIVSSGGKVDVAFGKGNSIYFVRSTNAGEKFSSPQLVDTLPKLALGMRRGPRIAEGKNSILLTAISHVDGSHYAWHSLDGTSWSEKKTVNDADTSAREGLHGLAGNGQGSYFAAWLDLRNKQMELWGAASHDGGKTWQQNIRIYKSPDGHICECCHPSVIFTGENEIAVMWRNWLRGSRDMFVAVSRDGGKTFGEAKKLGNGTWPLDACPMDGGSLSVSSTGEIISAWRRGDSILATEGDALEKFLGTGTQPVVGIVNGKNYFVWQQKEKLLLQTLPSSDAPRTLAEKGRFPAMASSAAGVAIVVWESPQNGIFGKWIE